VRRGWMLARIRCQGVGEVKTYAQKLKPVLQWLCGPASPTLERWTARPGFVRMQPAIAAHWYTHPCGPLPPNRGAWLAAVNPPHTQALTGFARGCQRPVAVIARPRPTATTVINHNAPRTSQDLLQTPLRRLARTAQLTTMTKRGAQEEAAIGYKRPFFAPKLSKFEISVSWLTGWGPQQ
jgi:hypothetical protein